MSTSTQPNTAIQRMFDGLPGVYELVNHVVTLGLDTVWRRKAARLATAASFQDAATECSRCPETGGKGGDISGRKFWLDVSTGTGEMAARLKRSAGPEVTMLATDFSLPMLAKAARKHGKGGSILMAAADTGRLPFRDSSFDLVTMSLATRNVNTSEQALISYLRELHRVLKPGGLFVNLETSQPPSPTVRTLFHAYVRGFLRPVGAAISGNKTAYSYLADTICSFYGAGELHRIIETAGFKNVTAVRLFLGVAAVHKAEKGTQAHVC